MQILKADTAVDVRMGPFVDATDGVTPETVSTVTLGGADQAELLKHNGAATTSIAGNTFADVASCAGWMDLSLTTGNTDTEGLLSIVIQDSSVCLPVFKEFMVVNANVYASFFEVAGADYLDTNMLQLAGSTANATSLGAGASGSVSGIVSTSSSDVSVTSDLSETTIDHYAGRVIIFLTGNLAGQASDITAYAADGTMTVTTLTEAPTSTDTFIIV